MIRRLVLRLVLGCAATVAASLASAQSAPLIMKQGHVAQAGQGDSITVSKSASSAAALTNNFTLNQTITGAATLTQPTTGYHWNFNGSTINTTVTSSSGWNQNTADPGGRTSVANITGFMTNTGMGDAGVYYGNCAIGGSGKPTETHWLANTACVILNGDLTTTLAHSYLNQFEFNLWDNGNDVAAIAMVENFHRTNNTAAQGEVWMGDRWQSVGTKAITVGWSLQGLGNIGVDTVLATADSTFNSGHTVALNMAANQRVVFNSTPSALNGVNYYGNNLGNAYDVYASSILSRCNGTACINLSTTADAITVPLQLPSYTVSTLPTCNSGLKGGMAFVTDATSPTYNAALTGGGAVAVPVFCNGTAWTSH